MIKVENPDPNAVEAPTAGMQKPTPQSRFLSALNNKYKAAIAAQQEVTDEQYQSASMLKAYNQAVADLTEFIKKNTRGVMFPTGETFKATITPQLKDQLEQLKNFGNQVKRTVDIQRRIQKSITSLDVETKGSTKYVKSYENLKASFQEGLDLVESDAPVYVKNITSILRKSLVQATESLEQNETWIPKFKMLKGGQQTFGPHEYTSSRFDLLKPPGQELALRGGAFRLGRDTTDKTDKSISIETDIDKQVKLLESTMLKLTRADSRRFRLVGEPYNPDQEYQYPGAGMGAHGGLPVPPGGGGGAGKGGPPIIAEYKNLPQIAGNFPIQRVINLPGEYTGQQVHAFPIPPTVKIGSDYQRPSAILAAIDPTLAALALIGEVAKDLYDIPRSFARFVEPLNQPMETLYRAGTTTGQGSENIARYISGGAATPTVSANWAALGYRNQQEAYDVYGKYGSAFRPNQAFLEATQLSQQPYTGFMGPQEYQEFLGKFTSLGLNQKAGGLEETKKAYEDAVYKGIEKGLPGPALVENIYRVLNMMTTTGIRLTNDQVMEMAVSGAGSAVPTLINAEAQTSAMQSYQNTLGNIFSDPFDLNLMMSESFRRFGTTSPSAKQIEQITGNTIPPNVASFLNDLRPTSPGGVAPGGTWPAYALWASSMAADPTFLLGLRLAGTKTQMPWANKSSREYMAILESKPQERTDAFNRWHLGVDAPKLTAGGTLPTGPIHPVGADEWLNYLKGPTSRVLLRPKDTYVPGAGGALGSFTTKDEWKDVTNFIPGTSVLNLRKTPEEVLTGRVLLPAHGRGLMYDAGGGIAGMPTPAAPTGADAMGLVTTRLLEANAINQTTMEAYTAIATLGPAISDLGKVIVETLQLIQLHLPDWGAPVSGGGISPIPAHHTSAGAP